MSNHLIELLISVLLLTLIRLNRAQELLENSRCNHYPDRGTCEDRGFTTKWYYDRYAHRCREFYYGGCEGNENRFDTFEECRQNCKYESIENPSRRCAQDHDPGPCAGDFERWHFDMRTRQCICSWWSGCGGNSNLFYSYDHCMSICGIYANNRSRTREITARRSISSAHGEMMQFNNSSQNNRQACNRRKGKMMGNGRIYQNLFASNSRQTDSDIRSQEEPSTHHQHRNYYAQSEYDSHARRQNGQEPKSDLHGGRKQMIQMADGGWLPRTVLERMHKHKTHTHHEHDMVKNRQDQSDSYEDAASGSSSYNPSMRNNQQRNYHIEILAAQERERAQILEKNRIYAKQREEYERIRIQAEKERQEQEEKQREEEQNKLIRYQEEMKRYQQALESIRRRIHSQFQANDQQSQQGTTVRQPEANSSVTHDLRTAEERRREHLKRRKMQRFEKLKKMEKLRKFLKGTPCSSSETVIVNKQPCKYIENIPSSSSSQKTAENFERILVPTIQEHSKVDMLTQQHEYVPEKHIHEEQDISSQKVTSKPDTMATELFDVRRNHHALKLGENTDEHHQKEADIAQRVPLGIIVPAEAVQENIRHAESLTAAPPVSGELFNVGKQIVAISDYDDIDDDDYILDSENEHQRGIHEKYEQISTTSASFAASPQKKSESSESQVSLVTQISSEKASQQVDMAENIQREADNDSGDAHRDKVHEEEISVDMVSENSNENDEQTDYVDSEEVLFWRQGFDGRRTVPKRYHGKNRKRHIHKIAKVPKSV